MPRIELMSWQSRHRRWIKKYRGKQYVISCRQAGTIRVLHGKGDKSRTVGIDQQALAVLDRWLDRRSELGINGRQSVFCTLDGSPVATVYVRNLLKRLGRKAGIEKRVHPHGLRHTCAAELRAEGSDMRCSSGCCRSTCSSHYVPTAPLQPRSWRGARKCPTEGKAKLPRGVAMMTTARIDPLGSFLDLRPSCQHHRHCRQGLLREAAGGYDDWQRSWQGVELTQTTGLLVGGLIFVVLVVLTLAGAYLVNRH